MRQQQLEAELANMISAIIEEIFVAGWKARKVAEYPTALGLPATITTPETPCECAACLVGLFHRCEFEQP